MTEAIALVVMLASGGGDPWSAGIGVPLPDAPVQVTAVASKWTVDYDYARGRAQQVTYTDCAVVVNRSSVRATSITIAFAAADPQGVLRRKTVTADVRDALEPGATSSMQRGCRADGYGNGDRGLWLVSWVFDVKFADGTRWHAPPDRGVSSAVAAALHTYGMP